MPRPREDGLQAYKIEGFRGLDLASDPEEVGASGAIDIADVEIDRYGRLRSRDGLTTVYTVPNVNDQPVDRLYPFNLVAQFVITASGSANKVYGVESVNWTLVASQALSAGAVNADVVVHKTKAYIADYTSALRTWDGAVFGTVGGAPVPKYLAVQSPDNRLVAGDCYGADPSRVQFSNAGDATTWGANDYVDITPNDGETITGLVSWREQVFAFKQSKFVRFNGNSIDATGNPVFNYQTVDVGLGISAGQSAVAGREGVYFVNQHGIWLTTGGPPAKISGALDPLFQGVTPAYLTSGSYVNNQGLAPGALHRLCYALGRLYAHLYMANGHWQTFIYDPATRMWTRWLGDVGYTTEFRREGPSGSGAIYTATSGYGGSSTKVRKLDTTVTTDDGSAIDSYYQSGFFDLDQPGMEKTIRETELIGQGTVQLSWARNMGTSMNSPSAANVTLGTAPATARGLHRNADYGELLSYKIASVSGGAFQVNGVVPMVQSVRPAGAMSS